MLFGNILVEWGSAQFAKAETTANEIFRRAERTGDTGAVIAADFLPRARRHYDGAISSYRDVDAAAARVRQTRGLLLPASTGSGRFTRYSSELRNAIALPAGVLPSVTNPSFVIREKQSGRVNGATTVPTISGRGFW